MLLCEGELAFHDHLVGLGCHLALATSALVTLLLCLPLGLLCLRVLVLRVAIRVLNNDLVAGVRRHRASFLGRTRRFSKPHVMVAAGVSVAHLYTTFNVVLNATAFACVALTYMSNRRRSWSTRLDVLTALFEDCSDCWSGC